MTDGGAARPPSISGESGRSMVQYYKSAVDTEAASKVPEVTLGFWIIKILATTLGETGGDAVTMSMNLG